MIMKRGSLFLWVAIWLGLTGFLVWAFWPTYHLEVSSLGRSKAPLSLLVSSGDRFSIWFLHSYDRAFFQENYQIDSHYRILLRDMTFKSHLSGGGFAYPHFHLRPDGVGELREINEPRERVEFMMGSPDLANHSLLWKGKRIELSHFFQPGEVIQIEVIQKNRLMEMGAVRGEFNE